MTTIASQPQLGLTQQSVSFNCSIEIDVLDQFVDVTLSFLAAPPSADVASAFLSASVTSIQISGISYPAVGKTILQSGVQYLVRLLTTSFDTSNVSIGDVDIELSGE